VTAAITAATIATSKRRCFTCKGKGPETKTALLKGTCLPKFLSFTRQLCEGHQHAKATIMQGRSHVTAAATAAAAQLCPRTACCCNCCARHCCCWRRCCLCRIGLKRSCLRTFATPYLICGVSAEFFTDGTHYCYQCCCNCHCWLLPITADCYRLLLTLSGCTLATLFI